MPSDRMIRLLIEDKRGNIMRLLGLDHEVADWLHGLSPKWSFALGKWYKETYDIHAVKYEANMKSVKEFAWGSSARRPRNQTREEAYEESLAFQMRYLKKPSTPAKATVTTVFNFLTKYPDQFQNIKNKEIKEVRKHIKAHKEKMKYNKDSYNVILEFDDGFFWYDTKSSKCEAWIKNKMQHCGEDRNGHLQILFDDKLEPHGTLTWSRHRNWIMQAVGKQNAVPDEKYWKYFEEFAKKFDVKFPPSILSFIERGIRGYDNDFYQRLRDANNEPLQEHWLWERLTK